MTFKLRAVVGVALALAMAGCQSDTHADDAPVALQAVEGGSDAAGHGASSNWRGIPAIGWALDEWEDALDRFGDLVELLPQPAKFLCEHVSEHDVLTRLRCEYWDRLTGQHDDDDDDDDEGEEDADRDERDTREDASDDWASSDDDVQSGDRPGLGD